jgi:cystathionine beta-lyase
LNVDGRYEINIDELEEHPSKPENKLLVLSSPHNPVGRLWSKEELERIGEICLRNDVLVLSDEIHSDLAIYGNKHIPFASLNKEFADNSLTFMAPSKTFNIAGFGTSYVVCGNKELNKKFRHVLNALHLNMGTIFSGVILEAAYDHGAEWLDEMLKYIEGNIDLVHDFLKAEIPEVTFNKPEATYLLWLDFRKLGREQDKLNSLLINEAGLGLNNGTLFGEDAGKGFMRMNVGSSRLVIQKALENMKRAFRER